MALARQLDWQGAVHAFDRATRNSPHDALYWLNLAHAQRRTGGPERALASVERALQIDPAHALALRLKVECLAELHRYAEAVQACACLEASGVQEPEVMVQHACML